MKDADRQINLMHMLLECMSRKEVFQLLTLTPFPARIVKDSNIRWEFNYDKQRMKEITDASTLKQ